MASIDTPGQRLLVNMIDYYADQKPTKIYACIPKDNGSMTQGFIDVSYKQLSNAINGTAWWLKENTVGEEQGFETVAYAGPDDLRFFILVMAAVKCGKRVLLTNTFTSADAQKYLLSITHCTTYLHAESYAPTFQPDPGIKIQAAPEQDEWLRGVDYQDFPYWKTWEEARSDPCMILHTSGITGNLLDRVKCGGNADSGVSGLPKPIVYSNQMMCQFDTAKLMPDADEETILDHWSNTRISITMPGSHHTSILIATLAIFLDSIIVMGPPEPPILSSILATVEMGNVKTLMSPPSFIEGLCHMPDSMQILSKLNYLYFGGAPLARSIAEKVARYTQTFPGMGTTEAGTYWLKVRNDDDWDYYAFRPAMGVIFEYRMDQLYELIFHKDPDLARWQQVFWVFPNISRFATGDLFTKHPSKPNLWRYAGRTDDAIVLSSAAKLHPIAVEEQIQRHPFVSAAIIGGEGRPRSFLLLELVDSQVVTREAQEGEIMAIWPCVEEFQRHWSDAVGLSRDFVAVASPGKPLVKTANGSIARKASLRLYGEEIAALYDGGIAGRARAE